MAVAYNTGANGSGTAATRALGAFTPALNSVAIVFVASATAFTVTSITDTQGNTYYPIVAQSTASGSIFVFVAWMEVNAATTTNLSFSSSINHSAMIFTHTGVNLGSLFEGTPTVSAANSSTPSAASVTNRSPDAAIVTYCFPGSNTPVITDPAGYSNRQTNGVTHGYGDSLIVTTAAVQSPVWGMTGGPSAWIVVNLILPGADHKADGFMSF